MLGGTSHRWEVYRDEKGHMSRKPLHALIWSEEHNRYDLYTQEHLEQSFLAEDTDAWLARLHGLTAFAFHGLSGSLNVYLEERPHGKQYWYAYHTRERRTRKRYLGQPDCVTFTRLEEVAKALGSESSSTLRASENGSDEGNAASQMSVHVPSGEALPEWRYSRRGSRILCCPPGCWRGNAY